MNEALMSALIAAIAIVCIIVSAVGLLAILYMAVKERERGVRYKVITIFYIPREVDKAVMGPVARECIKSNFRLTAQVHSGDVEVYLERG